MEGLENESSGTWIPLMDFAIKKGVSLSTLRRHIKANKVTFKVENGRYLLWDKNAKEVSSEVRRLERDLLLAREEIAELKTLIALYEEKISPQRIDY